MKKDVPTQHRSPFALVFLSTLFFCLFPGINQAQDLEYAPPIQNPFGIEYELTEGQHATVRLVDIDGDSVLEAFLFIPESFPNGSPCCSEIRYFENTGTSANPVFVPADHSEFGILEHNVIWPWHFVDIDNDGDFDLTYYAFALDAPVRILINNGTSTSPDFANDFLLNPYNIVLPESDALPGNLLDGVTPTFADLDHDCDLDLMYNGRFAGGMADEAYYFAENIGTLDAPNYAAPVKNGYSINFPGGFYHQSNLVDLD